LIRAVIGGVILAAWLAIRLARPAFRLRLPAVLAPLWRFLLPAGTLLWVGLAGPAWAAGLGVAFLAAHLVGTRTVGHLRRQVAGETAICREALEAEDEPAGFSDVAVCVLMLRYARQGMSRAEAVALAGRCRGLDELVAQVALREGGLGTYAAYLRRYGDLQEVSDADAAVHGDRFPGGPPSS
jgi:hypothetical protein